MIRPRLPRWLRKETWIAEAPGDDVSNLDMLDGVHPAGEVMPETAQEALRRDYPEPTIGQLERIASWLTEDAPKSFDDHVTDALDVVSPWNDADRATAAVMGVVIP